MQPRRMLVTDAATQPPRQSSVWLISTLGRKTMKNLAIAIVTLLAAHISWATSYLIPIEYKLDFAKVIAHVKVTKIEPGLDTEMPGEYANFSVEIIESFKGPSISPLEFRGHTYSHLSSDKLSGLVGQQFIIFLHDPDKTKKYWLYEGPRGMRPLRENYTEWRFADGKVVTDTYSHSEYIEKLRSIKATEESK